MTIKRIGPISCAKIAGVIYAAFGLLAGAMVSLFAMFGLAFAGAHQGFGDSPMSPLLGAVMGIGAIVAFPIFYGGLGFISALIGAWLYNLVASKVGGMEIDIS